MSGVKLTDIVEKMNLKNLTPEVDITEREVLVPDVNRPALTRFWPWSRSKTSRSMPARGMLSRSGAVRINPSPSVSRIPTRRSAVVRG